jgi:hypothetical protein
MPLILICLHIVLRYGHSGDLHSIGFLNQSCYHMVEQYVALYKKGLVRPKTCCSLPDEKVDIVCSALRICRHLQDSFMI